MDLLRLINISTPPRILVVGDIMLDEYFYGNVTRISPESPIPILKKSHNNYKLGGAANTAAAAKALGCETTCIGAIGHDIYGDIIESLMREYKIINKSITTNKITTKKTRIIGESSNKHPQQLIRIDEEETEDISKEAETEILKRISSIINTIDIVAIQDYKKGVITERLSREIIDLCNDHDIKVIIDPANISSTAYYERYKNAFLITPNRVEANNISKTDNPRKAAENIYKTYDIDNILITLDKDGLYLYNKDHNIHYPTIVEEVYDVTGAGDEVLIGMAYAIYNQFPMEYAAKLSNIIGGLEVKHFGARPIPMIELIKEIKSQYGNRKMLYENDLDVELKYLKDMNYKIVFTNGCFDLLHRGHIHLLYEAKKLGDILIVAVNSDESVKKLKGEERPIQNEKDRMDILSAIEYIDYLILFDDETPLELIKTIIPNTLVKGADTDYIVGSEIVEENGGKVIKIKEWGNTHSSGIINKILKNHK